MKALVQADGDRILGLTGFGVDAGDDVRRSGCDDRALYRTARRHLDSPRIGRGAYTTILLCAVDPPGVNDEFFYKCTDQAWRPQRRP